MCNSMMKVKYLVQAGEKLVSLSAEVTWKAINGLGLALGLEKGRMVGKFVNRFVCFVFFCFSESLLDVPLVF